MTLGPIFASAAPYQAAPKSREHDIMQTLRQQTAARHHALEQKLAPLTGRITASAYLILLQKMYGYYAPLEAGLAGSPMVSTLRAELAQRRKTHLLQADLHFLGCTHATLSALPMCERLPPLQQLDQLWGCLYVLEGATLGGQIILRQLRRNLGLDADGGASFFGSYGVEIGPMWSQFKSLLLAHCAGAHAIEPIICRSAAATFETLDAWLFGAGGDQWLTQA